MKFTLGVAICFTLNYTIGSGFLTLPWAFTEAGLVMGPMILTIMAILAFFSAWMVLETMARGSALLQLKETEKGGESSAPGVIADTKDSKSMENKVGDSKVPYGSLASEEREADSSSAAKGTALEYPLVIGQQRLEMPELCETFLGSMGKTLYMISLATYAYGSMWAYSTVFANAWARAFPINDFAHETCYRFYLFLWALVEIPWSTMELEEQIVVQVTLTAGRILLVIVMVTTVLLCDSNDNNSFLLQSDGSMGITSTVDSQDLVEGPTIGGRFVDFDWSNLHVILAISVYANNLHHSVATLVQPLENKRQSGLLFVASFTITTISYVFLGVTLATYFGTYIPSSSNLTWATYVGVDPSYFFSAGTVPFYAQVISAFVVLFPSIDVASTFPLLAVTLGNGLMAVAYPEPVHLARAHKSLRITLSYRFLAAIPPIMGAFCVSNLGSVTAYTGLTGVFISLVFPAALALSSKMKLEQAGLRSDTLWTHGLSHTLSVVVLVLGLIISIFVLGNLAIKGVPSGLE